MSAGGLSFAKQLTAAVVNTVAGARGGRGTLGCAVVAHPANLANVTLSDHVMPTITLEVVLCCLFFFFFFFSISSGPRPGNNCQVGVHIAIHSTCGFVPPRSLVVPVYTRIPILEIHAQVTTVNVVPA